MVGRLGQWSSVIALAVGMAAACGGTTLGRGGHDDRADSGFVSQAGGSAGDRDASMGGGGSGGANNTGLPCTKDTDCGAPDLICELGRCTTAGSVVYPTEPAGEMSTTFPTTCFASDIGVLETRLVPPEGHTGFGAAVTLDGDQLAVGTGTDGVTVYRRDGSAWNRRIFLSLPEPESESVHVMAQSGDTLVVGAPSYGSNQAGAAYVFDLGPDAGAPSQKLIPDPAEAGLRFGSSVAVDGQTLVVASRLDFTIFDGASGTWSGINRIFPDTPVAPEALSVSLRGDLLAVGAYWFLPSVNSEGSAVFFYRKVAGIFGFESRIDPDAPTISFWNPLLGDGLVVVGSDPTTIYANGGRAWSLEARLADGPSSAMAVDGTQIAVGTTDGIRLHERTSGAWPLALTLKPHDVSTGTYFGVGSVAVRGNVVAVGDGSNQGSGGEIGAAYVFEKVQSSSASDCATATKSPPRVEGAGTGCVDPGSGVALCPFVSPGTSTVSGMTPYGALAFPFAWTDSTNGFTQSTSLVFSNVAPRRDGTSPKLGFTLQRYSGLSIGTPIQAEFSLELCSRSVMVDGFVTLDEAPTDAFGHVVPISGSIAIEHDGWAVKGSFRIDTLCAWSSSH